MIKREDLIHIVERCKQQDRRAQKLIYESYHDRYFTLCLRYLNSDDLASEAVNEMFFLVFTKLNDIDDLSLFEGWMKRVCINVCLNHIKKNKRHVSESFDEKSYQLFIDHSENEALSRLSLEELLSLVQTLPTQMRSVFNLYTIDGFKHNDIAEMLNISVGTSKFHLHQAKLRLQKAIGVMNDFEKKQKRRSYV